jgi:hypothetical protein
VVILAADWSVDPRRRALWRADVAARTVAPVPGDGWDLAAVLAAARSHRRRGPVLVAMDLVLGTSRGYFHAARRRARWRTARHFLDLLTPLADDDPYWDTARGALEWSPARPFFAVPAGRGALTAFQERAGFDLMRSVDRRCQSNPPFAVSGIPGTVGSGTRALWRELAPLLRARRDFRVWPFEGSLQTLLAARGIALAELYPALAYAVALRPSLPARRLRVAKTRPGPRAEVLRRLAAAPWVARHGVGLEALATAQASEDHFDALVSAAAVLRLALEGLAIDEPGADDPVAEGGILLTGATDFVRGAERLGAPAAPAEGGA